MNEDNESPVEDNIKVKREIPKHLIPYQFKKGHGGIPRKTGYFTFKTLYERVMKAQLSLENSVDEDLKIIAAELGYDIKEKISIKELIVIKDVARALRGDRFAMDRIQCRCEGLPKQMIEQVRKQLQIKYDDSKPEDLKNMDNFETNTEIKQVN